MRAQTAAGLMMLFLLARPGWSRVFIHWTQPAIPPARSLGISSVVISWGQNNLVTKAREEGYHVFLEANLGDAKSAAAASAREGLAGIIVQDSGNEPSYGRTARAHEAGSTASLVRSLRAAYPHLSIRLLEGGGKQPQMKGTLLVNRNGVMAVSSPTRQPWIDSNVALIRFERVYDPNEKPLFDFGWELTDSAEKQYGPPAEDYELAVAEAGAFHADVILPLYPTLQDDLAARTPQAWKNWREIERYIQFYSRATRAQPVRLISNVRISTNDYNSSYEATNLMARHNIPYHIIRPRELASGELEGSALIVVFSSLDGAAAKVVDRFVASGGTAVLVGQRGKFPWHAAAPLRENNDSTIYRIGSGKLVEITGPILDPEPFAEDVWRLLAAPDREMSLWNALTVLAAAYRSNGGAGVSLNLVNYSGQALRVQVRLKGQFSSIRYETPEVACCVALAATHDDGFTEFIVPKIRTGAWVHLLPAVHYTERQELSAPCIVRRLTCRLLTRAARER